MKIGITIRGTSPMLHHSARLVDDLDPICIEKKRLTDKKTAKTAADKARLAYLDFLGGLYWDEERKCVYIPDAALTECIRRAAGLCARGAGRSAVNGIEVVEENPQLIFDAPKGKKLSPEILYGDGRTSFVDRRAIKQQASRLMRVRARFNDWSVSFTLDVDEQIVRDAETVREWLETAGYQCGLGDYRPSAPKPGKFGRFEVTRFEVLD